MIRSLAASVRKEDQGRWEQRAPAWERWEPFFQHALSPINPPLLRALELAPGQRVLDVGCGSGDPSLEIARWVAPRGSVLGVDISRAMLATARARAQRLGVRNVRFRRMDLDAVDAAGARFDRLVSRFSLMFAGDVPAALERMRRTLRRRGRAAIAVWGPMAANPGTRLREAAVRPFLAAPPPDPETAPHPMRLGRRGLLARLMTRAGFTRVVTASVRTYWTYPSFDDYLRMQTDSTLADLVAKLSARDRRALDDRLRRAFRPFQDGEVLRYPALAWVVTAEAP